MEVSRKGSMEEKKLRYISEWRVKERDATKEGGEADKKEQKRGSSKGTGRGERESVDSVYYDQCEKKN